MKKAITIVLVLAALLFVGCSMIPAKLNKEYQKITVAEQQITQLRDEHKQEILKAEQSVSVKKDEIIVKKDVVIESQDTQLQAAANSLYGADTAFNFYTVPNRIDLIINNRVNEASAATGKKPTVAAMEIENKRLADELDETKTSLDKLKKDHEEKIKQNTELVEATQRHLKEVEKIRAEMEDLKRKNAEAIAAKLHEIDVKQQEVITTQNKVIALEKERADNAAWVQSVKLKIMGALGLLALGCVAGAIWSPAFKGKFAVAAAVFAGAGVAVMYIQPWMIIAVCGVVAIGVAIKIVLEHKAVDRTAGNLINYVQDMKESGSALFNKEKLKNWNGKYVTGPDGKTIVVPDNEVERVIEEKLKEHNRI